MTKRFLLILLRSIIITIQGTYDIVSKFWMRRDLYQGGRWLTWSKDGVLGFRVNKA